jgi:surface antigen
MVGAVAALTVGSLAFALPASAATTYKVQGTDGTLAVQAEPKVDNIIRWLHEGDQVQVICQINNGGTDPYDGLTSHTWDSIVGGGWVYDHFITTPAQDANGWSPGVPHCGTGTSSLDPNGYPWPNAVNADGSPAWIADGHGYYEGECTSFAAWAIRADGMSHSKSPDWLGNANTWSGAYVDSAPHAGDVLQLFYDGTGGQAWGPNGAGSLGHVAYVAAVNGDGTVKLYEYNWGNVHHLNIRTVAANQPDSRYLHF